MLQFASDKHLRALLNVRRIRRCRSFAEKHAIMPPHHQFQIGHSFSLASRSQRTLERLLFLPACISARRAFRYIRSTSLCSTCGVGFFSVFIPSRPENGLAGNETTSALAASKGEASIGKVWERKCAMSRSSARNRRSWRRSTCRTRSMRSPNFCLQRTLRNIYAGAQRHAG